MKEAKNELAASVTASQIERERVNLLFVLFIYLLSCTSQNISEVLIDLGLIKMVLLNQLIECGLEVSLMLRAIQFLMNHLEYLAVALLLD